MKNKIFIIVLSIVMLFVPVVMFVGCGKDDDKQYSITVAESGAGDVSFIKKSSFDGVSWSGLPNVANENEVLEIDVLARGNVDYSTIKVFANETEQTLTNYGVVQDDTIDSSISKVVGSFSVNITADTKLSATFSERKMNFEFKLKSGSYLGSTTLINEFTLPDGSNLLEAINDSNYRLTLSVADYEQNGISLKGVHKLGYYHFYNAESSFITNGNIIECANETLDCYKIHTDSEKQVNNEIIIDPEAISVEMLRVGMKNSDSLNEFGLINVSGISENSFSADCSATNITITLSKLSGVDLSDVIVKVNETILQNEDTTGGYSYSFTTEKLPVEYCLNASSSQITNITQYLISVSGVNIDLSNSTDLMGIILDQTVSNYPVVDYTKYFEIDGVLYLKKQTGEDSNAENITIRLELVNEINENTRISISNDSDAIITKMGLVVEYIRSQESDSNYYDIDNNSMVRVYIKQSIDGTYKPASEVTLSDLQEVQLTIPFVAGKTYTVSLK